MNMLSSSVALLLVAGVTEAFVSPVSPLKHAATAFYQPLVTASSSSTAHHMMADITSTMDVVDSASNLLQSTNMLAFADQGQNLAGIFFQASLLPYLAFLYFLSFRANRIPALGNFGFQFLLLFVLATIPSGIISRATYGCSLADVDWLHGGAEALLTISNVLLVLGFKEAISGKTAEEKTGMGISRALSFGAAGLFAAACALGPGLGFEAHSPFLLGAGSLPTDLVSSLPFVQHSEPVNALSLPTWAIHFSSVFEYLLAMNLVWQFAAVTENEKWKGLTWGMIPLHASGICACTYHFFYNPSTLQFLVTMQAGFTCLGNITCAIAAYRIAASNGWTFAEVNPFPESNTSPAGLIIDTTAAAPLVAVEETESEVVALGKIAAATIACSYLLKYGELALDVPFTPNAPVALAMVLGIPALTAASYANLSKDDASEGEGFSFPSFGGDSEDGGGLSMADVKKYGVSGTVAYVLTELAFWAVAFPVASTALYQTTGHWPDVINDSAERATVLGFIFAGANVARLLVPLRLGAALALAPWVDENILNREGNAE
jgi:hypothetical protein